MNKFLFNDVVNVYRKTKKSVSIIGLAFVILILAYVVLDSWRDYNNTLEDNEKRLRGYRISFAEHASQTFNSTQWVLDRAFAYLNSRELSGFTESEIRLYMKNLITHFPHIGWINIKDKNAVNIANTSEYPVTKEPHPNLDYIKYHKDNPSTEQLFFSKPALGVVTKRWRFFITKRISDAHGRFAGVIGCAFDPTYYDGFYKSVDLGKTWRVLLIRDDGQILVQSPFSSEAMKTNLSDRILFTTYLPQSASGIYRSRTTGFDLSDRIVSYQHLKRFPIIATVSITYEEAISTWKLRTFMKFGLTTLFLILAAYLAYLLFRSLQKASSAENNLKQTENVLEESEERFKSFMNETPVYAYIKDHSLSHVYQNRRVSELGEVQVLKGKPDSARTFFNTETAELVENADKKILSGECDTLELGYAITKNGEVRWLSDHKFAIEVPGKQRMVGGLAFDITDHKRAEEALRESEEKFRYLSNNAPIMVGTTDEHGNITFFNKTWLEFRGTTFEEEAGWGWTEALHPEDRDKTIAAMEEAMSLWKKYSLEYRIKDLYGEYHWLLDTAIPTLDANGNLKGYIGTAVNITDRKRAEEMIKKRLILMEYSATHTLEELLQKTLDEVEELLNSPIGFYHFVEKDQKTLSLQAWSTRTIKEFCKAEGKGLHYSIDKAGVWADCLREKRPVIHNDYNSLPHRKGLPEGHAPVIRELVVPIIRDGDVVAILGVGNKSSDYTDKDIDLVSFFADVAWEITKRKRTEEKMRESEERFSMAVAGTGAGLWDWDMVNNLVFFSSQWKTMLGYDDHEVEDDFSGWKNLWHPEDAERIEKAVKDYLDGKTEKYEIEHRLRHKDGTWHWILTRGDIHYDSAGKPARWIGTNIDVTDRKRVEEELQLNKKRLEALLELTLMTDFSESELTHFAMEEAVLLTNSSIGYVAFANEDETILTMYAWSKEAMRECSIESKPVVYKVCETGLWGEAIRQRRAVITNDYAASNPFKKGVPNGHVQIKRHMNAPIFDGDRIVIVAGVGNKPSDYGNDDVNQLTLLMSGLWTILRSRRAEQALKESEKRFRDLTELLPQIVFETDRDGLLTYANRIAFDKFSYTWEDYKKGLNVLQMIEQNDREQAMENFRNLVKGIPGTQAKEYLALRKDGSTFPVSIFAAPVVENDRIIGLRGIIIDLTERKQAEEARLVQEQRFRLLVQNSNDIIQIIDRDGVIIYVSDHVERILGYTPLELTGISAFTGIHPDDLTRVMASVDSGLAESGAVRKVEYRYRHKQGPWVPLECIGSNLLLNPSVQGIVLNIRDITDRKRAEEQLQVSESRYRSVISVSNTGAWEFNNKSKYLWCSPEYFEMLGRSQKDFLMYGSPNIDETWINLLHPEERQRAADHFANYLENGSAGMYENFFRMQHADGTWLWIWARGKTLRNSDGSLSDLTVGTHINITEQKRIEQQLRENEERLRLALEVENSGIYEIDLKTREFKLDRSIAKRLGFEAGQEPKTLEEWVNLCHPEDQPKVRSAITAYLMGEIPVYEFEVRTRRTDGTYTWGYTRGRVVEREADGTPRRLLGTSVNVDARKQAEEEREKLQNQLTQAQKMETVGRLAGGVAHDFNNMLNVILGYSAILQSEIEHDHPFVAYLDEIQNAARRSADLTRQLLAFARKQTVAPKVLDINETVAGMLKMIQRLIGEDIELIWKPGQDIWPIKVDPSQIDQILANLCVNSRDAIAGVGNVTIETANVAFDEAYCAIHSGFIAGEYVLLAVSDNGCGMNAETLSHIFEPFFTTKETGKGTGLGLATVYGTVKQNNGFLNVYSELGFGTTLKVYLPRHTDRPFRKADERRSETSARGKETILVVEDEPAILKMIEMMLERLGYSVLPASTPGEAIRLANEHSGRIDMLMTDVVMPEMNGRDLAKRLLSIYPDISRLFMSGYTANVIAHHGVLDEGVHFIQKPFSENDLAAKIREALEKR